LIAEYRSEEKFLPVILVSILLRTCEERSSGLEIYELQQKFFCKAEERRNRITAPASSIGQLVPSAPLYILCRVLRS